MTDPFTAGVTVAIRRALFLKLRDLGLSQSEVTALVADAANAVVARTELPDLVMLVGAVAPLRTALITAAPADPAITAFDAVRDTVTPTVAALLET